LKNIIMFRSVAKNKKVVIDHINPNQDDKRIINGFNVHKEYGLYDNKIKADDHIFWYKKFKELGV